MSAKTAWCALVLLGLTLFCMASAWAGSATLSWTPPTTRTDGSPLTNLAGYRIYHGTSATALNTRVDVNNSAATSITLDGLPAGLRYFAMTAVDADGRESARTGTVSTTIVDANPNPPTGFTVVPVVAGLNMNPVYRINADGTRGSAVLGFVPVGTACTGPVVYKYRSKAYYRVDPSAVRWWATAPTTAVAAPCA